MIFRILSTAMNSPIKDKIYMHVNYFHAQSKIEHRNGVKTVTIVITLP